MTPKSSAEKGMGTKFQGHIRTPEDQNPLLDHVFGMFVLILRGVLCYKTKPPGGRNIFIGRAQQESFCQHAKMLDFEAYVFVHGCHFCMANYFDLPFPDKSLKGDAQRDKYDIAFFAETHALAGPESNRRYGRHRSGRSKDAMRRRREGSAIRPGDGSRSWGRRLQPTKRRISFTGWAPIPATRPPQWSEAETLAL
jgi:hypothetical protein